MSKIHLHKIFYTTTVMRQRYFYLWPWKRIAAATHYSITYTKLVRAEAIAFLKK